MATNDEIKDLVDTVNRMTANLRQSAQLADAIAEGDLSVDHKALSDKDLLGHALIRMTANLRKSAQLADTIAAGDLTVDHQPLSDRDVLGRALVLMIERLRGVVSDATLAAQNVASGSQQLSSSSEQMSQGATEQRRRPRKPPPRWKRWRPTSSRTPTMPARPRRSPASPRRMPSAAVRRWKKAVVAMRTIAEKIVIVQEIARQTDLLALNAAVRGRARRGTWPRLRGRRRRSAQAGRTQPDGGGRDQRHVVRHGGGRATGGRNALQAGARHPAHRGTGRRNQRRLPRTGHRLQPDQRRDPAARPGDTAECRVVGGDFLDLRGTCQPGRGASGKYRILPCPERRAAVGTNPQARSGTRRGAPPQISPALQPRRTASPISRPGCAASRSTCRPAARTARTPISVVRPDPGCDWRTAPPMAGGA